MLVAEPGEAPALLDFFVAAPGARRRPRRARRWSPPRCSSGRSRRSSTSAPSACGVYGTPAGICEAHRRYATMPLAELVARGARLAREGVEVNAQQAYIFHLLAPLFESSDGGAREVLGRRAGGARGRRAEQPRARRPRSSGSRAEGAAPFYAGDIAEAAVARVAAGGGTLTLADLAAYEATPREPIHVGYRGHDVFTNPPPSAGGILIAYVLALLEREPAPPSQAQLVAAMEAAQRARTPEFLEGLARPGFLDEFMGSQLGSTTHISVLDGDGRACAVTCTNGEGSGVIVPGTGIHLNNMMGEEDLSPLGFFTHPPGRRLPSMMAPDRGRARRRGDARARLGRLQPHPLGDPAGDPRRDRPRARPASPRSRRRACTGRTGSSTPSRARRAEPPRAGSWRTSPISTCSSAAPRPCGATRPPASWPAPATRAAAARSSWPDRGQTPCGRSRVCRRFADDQLGRQHDVGGRARPRSPRAASAPRCGPSPRAAGEPW